INIILKQNTDRGLSGSLNGGIGTNDTYTIGGNISYGSGPWNIFANYGFNTGRRNSNGSRYQENRLVQPITAVNSIDSGTNKYTGHALNGSIEYAFNKQNSL